MSYLQYAIEQFGFKSMEEVTANTLKRAFKKQALISHPDKGGSEGDFDLMLSAYLYVSEMIQRMSGGRIAVQNVDAPDEIKQARANQLMNEIYDEITRETSAHAAQQQRVRYGQQVLPEDFHEQFEKNRDSSKGYQEWLREGGTVVNTLLDRSDFNAIFNSTESVNPVATSIIIHPDEMAYPTGAVMGTEIIDNNENFSSEPGLKPEYCDLCAAYTTENTVYKKVHNVVHTERTLDELIKERETIFNCYKDEDLEAIATYERNAMEIAKKHRERVSNYYDGFAKVLTNDDDGLATNDIIHP